MSACTFYWRPGPAGPQGIPGISGTITKVVQFCSTQIPQYPTSFPEIGLCIDGILYADYWDGKNSWLTQVTPGLYMSTSTGLQCNFTVLPGCIIQ